MQRIGSMKNPFLYGNPVPADQFLDRRRELRRIADRITNQGQSTAIMGEPRSGKTSLLMYLADPDKQEILYGEYANHLLFSFIDAQNLATKLDPGGFWAHVLEPLVIRAIRPSPQSSLAQAYETCKANQYGSFVMERLLGQMAADSWRLVLMIDEFNGLLHHPALNSAEFFGSLRSLASRSRGALALIIASRHMLETLNRETQNFSRTSSPYFNFLDEVTLGPLPDREVAELLKKGEQHFTVGDRRFIMATSGAHPYLLQLSAAALWDAYEDGGYTDEVKRRQAAGQDIHSEAGQIMADTWRVWLPPIRKAFAAVAFAQIPRLLGEEKFMVDRLIADLPHLQPELDMLEKQGFIVTADDVSGGWRVRPAAFLWWLADELKRTLRKDEAFEDWLMKQQLDGVLTKVQKQQLEKAARNILDLLKGGAKALIEGTAKGFGEGFGKSIAPPAPKTTP